jgi:phenylalanyl-tRNA synthetase alpha chain
MEQAILDHIVEHGELENTQQFAAQHEYNHAELVGAVKSLASDNFVVDTPVAVIGLSDEA